VREAIVGKTRARPEQPKPPLLLAVPREEAERRISERIEKGSVLKEAQISSSEELKQAENERRVWSSFNAEMLRRFFTSPEIADEYSSWGVVAIGRAKDLTTEIRDIAEKSPSKSIAWNR
jgi:hypothetical protein